MPERLCQYCNEPLPAGLHPRRIYHFECAKIVYNVRHVKYNQERRQRLLHPRHKRDPMLMLGMDYVDWKLKGIKP